MATEKGRIGLLQGGAPKRLPHPQKSIVITWAILSGLGRLCFKVYTARNNENVRCWGYRRGKVLALFSKKCLADHNWPKGQSLFVDVIYDNQFRVFFKKTVLYLSLYFHFKY